MTTYRITAPNGQTYQIDGPPGASDADVARAVMAQFPESAKAAPPPEEGVLRQAADVPVSIARGAAMGVRMVADAFGANNPVSNSIKGVEDYLGGLLSAQAKQDEQEVARIMKDAEDKGVLEQVKAGFKAFATAPVDLLAQGLGTAAPAIVGGLGATLLRVGATGARAVGAGIGAGMGSGAVKGQIYEGVKEALAETGMSPEQVEARAQLAQSYGGENLDMILTGAALGGLASATGIEPILARQAAKSIVGRSIAGRAATTGVAEAVPEIAQGSQEQLAQNIALQREGFDVDTMRGVVGAGTLEGLAGAGLGATVGATSQLADRRPRGEEPPAPDAAIETPPDVEPAAADVDVEPVDAELEAPAPQADLETPPTARFSDEDLVATGVEIPPASLPLIRRLTVGKTREELQGFVAENPEYFENDSTAARVIRSLVAEPVGRPEQIVVEPPAPVASPVAGPAAIPAQAPTPAVSETPSGITTPEAVETKTQRPEAADPTVPVIEDIETPVAPSDSWNTMDQQVRTKVAQAAGLKKPENFASKKWGSLPKDARTKLAEAIATQEASAAPPAGEGRVPSIEEVETTRQIEDLEKQRRKIERTGASLLGTLRRIGMAEEDLKEVYGRKIPLSAQNLRYKDRRGTNISTLVANGTLDAWLPYDKRLGAANFDGQEAEQIIKDRLGEKRFLTEDTEMDMRRLSLYIDDLEQALKLEDINAELEIAAQEQRDLDQEAEADAARPEDRATGRAEEAQAGAAPAPSVTPTFPRVDSIESFSVGPGGGIKPKVIAKGRPLYRETNVEGLNDLLQYDKQFEYSEYFVTDNQEIAIGQGGNTGVQIVFRPNSLSGKESRKPGTGDLAGREYKTDVMAPRAIQSVTMSAKAVNQTRPFARRILNAEFDKQTLPNGDVLFTRKGLEAAPDLKLTPATPETFQAEEERAKQAAAEEARAAEEAEKAKAEAGKERERKEIAARSVGAADDFQLGQTADQNLTGQKDILFSTDAQISTNQEKQDVLARFKADLEVKAPDFRTRGWSGVGRIFTIRPRQLTKAQVNEIVNLASEAIDLGMPASILKGIKAAGSANIQSNAAITQPDGHLLLGTPWASMTFEKKLQTFIHEIGHQADYKNTEEPSFSNGSEWSKAYKELESWYESDIKERKKTGAAAAPNSHPVAYPFAPQFKNAVRLKQESFAQAFAYYFTDPVLLQSNAPIAFGQIQSILEGIQNESQPTSRTSDAARKAAEGKVQPATAKGAAAVRSKDSEVVSRGGQAADSDQRGGAPVKGEKKTEAQKKAEQGSPVQDPDALKGEGKKAVENSRESILYQPIDGTWNTPMDPKPLKLSDEFFYNWVDKQIDLKRVVDAIGATGKRIAGKFNALERERTYHGRVAKRTQDYLTGELQPTIELMQKYGITQREIGEYLLNRHAPEANKVIADRNPRFPDAGSSVKTADAIKYMNSLDPLRKRQLDAVAKRMDKTLTKMQDMLVKRGVESQDTIDGWRDMFQYYIPLVRDDADYSINKVMSQGAGYSRSGDSAKSRTGSAKEVNLDEIFSNIAMQHERMIVRAEGNRVGQAVFGLALQNPNPGFWLALDPDTNVIWKTIKELEDIKADRDLLKEMLDSGELSPSQEAEYRMELDLIRRIIRKKEKPARAAFAKARDDLIEGLEFSKEDATKLVEQLMMPPMKARYNKEKNEVVYEPNAAVNNEFVFATRVNGSDKFVLFNANDERANRMVRGLKNMDAENLSEAMNIAAKITRFFAAINTQYNPVFGAYNFLRDVQTAALQISTTDIADKRKDVINGTPAALKAIFQVARARRDGKKVKGELADDFEEFENEGGQTGFRDQFSQSAERAEAIQRMIDPSSWASSPLGKFFTAGGTLKVPFETMRKGAAPLFNLLSDYNQTLENAVRLSAYRVAREKFKSQGMSPADARQKAATIAKDITVNFNQKGVKTTQMGALYAFFNASIQGTNMMARTLAGPLGRKIIAGGMLWGVIQTIMLAMAGFDDEEPPEFVKQRNFVIPYGLIVPGAEGKYLAFPMPLGFNVIPTLSRLATEAVISGGENVSGKAVSALDAVMDMFNPIGNAGLSFQTITPTLLDPAAALFENKSWTGQDIAREDFNPLNPTPGFTRSRDSANALSQEVARLLNAMTGGTEDRKGLISPTADQLEYLTGQLTGGVGRETIKGIKSIEALITDEELPSYSVPLVGRFHGDVNEMAAVSSAFYRNLTELNIQKEEIKTIRENKGNLQAYLAENPEARLAQMATTQYNQVKKLRKLRQEALEKGDKERAKKLEETIKKRMVNLNERYEKLAD